MYTLTMFIVSQLLQTTDDHKTKGMNILCASAQLHQPQSSNATPTHGGKHVTDSIKKTIWEKKA
jgi:hypothetical protein